MKRIGMFITFVMLIASVTAASAEINAGSFSVTPFAGGYYFEGNEDLKESYTVGLRAGYNITENLGLEGFFNYVPTEIDDLIKTDVDLYGYGIEGLYHFMPGSKFVPFLAVGLGGIYYKLSSDEMNKFAVDYGAGVKFFIKDNIALRADIRHVIPLNDTYNDLLFTLGVSFTFGGEKKIAEVKNEEQPAPVEIIADSDKDGVPDNLDKCPETSAGVAVDNNGCPLDSDKDGVPDNLDRCPGTAAGVSADKNGCAPDSDNDGVADYLDKCPETPAGIKVNGDGCPSSLPEVAQKMDIQERVSIVLYVEFDTAKAVVKNKYHDEIKKVADFMVAHPETNVVIEGHTDNVDRHNDPNRNIRLSQARADSIRKYLIDKFGIDESRISAVGYGPNKPVASNDTEKGRKKNRRVEALIEAVQTKNIK